MVFALAAGLGLIRAFTAPGQQAFASELVAKNLVQSAVSLNSMTTNAARAVGPAIAGVLIATTGAGVCFFLNAASFLPALWCLWRMNPKELASAEVVEPEPGQIAEGVRYVRSERELLAPLLMIAAIGMLAYEFQVSLPLLATGLGGGAGGYGLMSAAMGAGAVIGCLFINHRLALGVRSLARLAAIFGFTIAAAALAPTLPVSLAMLFCVGTTSTAFMSTAASTLQLTSLPQFRGRVMALWSVAFLGTTPLGAPMIGAICEGVSPRAGLLVGAATCVLCAAAASLTDRSPGWAQLLRVRVAR